MTEFISVSAIKASLTECPICTKQFDEDSRIPRRMPCCVQSICHPCLETYSRGSQTLTCPICRQQHHLPGGVKSLPKEHIVLHILDHLKIQKGLRLPCTDCPDSAAAMAQCDNCGIFLCTQCHMAHVRNRVTKNHTLVTFEEMKDRPVESFRRLHQCMEHQQVKQFFCHTCNKAICVSCTVVEHKEGKGHNVVSIDEAHQDKGTSTEDVLTKLNEKATKLNQSVLELQKKKKNIETSRQRAKDDINNKFNVLAAQLEERRKVLLSDVDEKLTIPLKQTEEALDSTSTLLAKVQSSTEYTKTMRSRADRVEDVQFMVSSAESLTAMLEESPNEVEFDRTGVVYVPMHIQHLTLTINASGLVRQLTYCSAERPEGIEEDKLCNQVTIEPPGVVKLPDVDLKLTEEYGEIICPDIEWDFGTASSNITVSKSVVTNTPPNPPPPDTGCRIQSDRRVLGASPLIIRRGQRVMYHLKTSFTLRKVAKINNMIAELGLVSEFVDSTYNQSELSVIVSASATYKQKICLKLRYNDKVLTEVPVCTNKVGVSHDLHLCFILNRDKHSIHVVDVNDFRLVGTVTNAVIDRPLWVMMYLDLPSWSDIKGEVVSGNNIKVPQELIQISSTLI